MTVLSGMTVKLRATHRLAGRSCGSTHGWAGVDRHVPGLGSHPFQPGADRRIGLELEPTFGRDVRVCVERDVGDRVSLGDQVLTSGEMALHRLEGGETAAPFGLKLRVR